MAWLLKKLIWEKAHLGKSPFGKKPIWEKAHLEKRLRGGKTGQGISIEFNTKPWSLGQS